jgi:hypothetical protein
MHPMHVLAGVRVNQEVGLVADLDIEPFAQEIVKEIAGFLETGPEIAKIKADFHSLSIAAA